MIFNILLKLSIIYITNDISFVFFITLKTKMNPTHSLFISLT